MKTTSQILAEKIAAACAATAPRTKARNKALASIKWRLESFEGLVAGLDGSLRCCLCDPASPLAQTFDARDNEKIKQSFYQSVLGVELAIVLL